MEGKKLKEEGMVIGEKTGKEAGAKSGASAGDKAGGEEAARLGGDEGERVGREIAGDEVIQFHMKFCMFLKQFHCRVQELVEKLVLKLLGLLEPDTGGKLENLQG